MFLLLFFYLFFNVNCSENSMPVSDVEDFVLIGEDKTEDKSENKLDLKLVEFIDLTIKNSKLSVGHKNSLVTMLLAGGFWDHIEILTIYPEAQPLFQKFPYALTAAVNKDVKKVVEKFLEFGLHKHKFESAKHPWRFVKSAEVANLISEYFPINKEIVAYHINQPEVNIKVVEYLVEKLDPTEISVSLKGTVRSALGFLTGSETAGETLLHQAAAKDMAIFLAIWRKATDKRPLFVKSTPLHCAIRAKQLENQKTIMQDDPEQKSSQDEFSRTPLFYVTSKEQIEALQLEDKDWEVTDNKGKKPKQVLPKELLN